ncbi:MAG: hypothetical protein ACK2UK_12110 [Candidatus Promineifilaceae bacterium]
MNERTDLQPIIIALFGLAIVGMFILLGPGPAGQVHQILPPVPQVERTNYAAEAKTSTEHAADISAQRWQAMAAYYEREGLLTRDPFDYAAAAEQAAFRWLAIGKGYERLGLLNDTLDAGDIAALRWQAIAHGYERLGLLNE